MPLELLNLEGLLATRDGSTLLIGDTDSPDDFGCCCGEVDELFLLVTRCCPPAGEITYGVRPSFLMLQFPTDRYFTIANVCYFVGLDSQLVPASAIDVILEPAAQFENCLACDPTCQCCAASFQEACHPSPIVDVTLSCDIQIVNTNNCQAGSICQGEPIGTGSVRHLDVSFQLTRFFSGIGYRTVPGQEYFVPWQDIPCGAFLQCVGPSFDGQSRWVLTLSSGQVFDSCCQIWGVGSRFFKKLGGPNCICESGGYSFDPNEGTNNPPPSSSAQILGGFASVS